MFKRHQAKAAWFQTAPILLSDTRFSRIISIRSVCRAAQSCIAGALFGQMEQNHLFILKRLETVI